MAAVERLTDLIGNTPILKLNNYMAREAIEDNLYAKLEYFNPLGSVKDRAGYAMIEDGEKKGLISKDTVIIESTSGNTGVALAFVCAAKGYKLILTMPESMSVERRNLLTALGAELYLTPAVEGMNGALQKAKELAETLPDTFMPQQFDNPANAEIHKRTTAREIWRDMDGNIDYFIAGVGSGGTLTGVGEFLKNKNKEICVIGVEPASCAVLSGKRPGAHRIQGLGAGFVPSVLNTGIYDEIIAVADEDAINETVNVAKAEGLLVGISSGAVLAAAKKIAARQTKGKANIVMIFPDTGERYLSMGIYSKE